MRSFQRARLVCLHVWYVCMFVCVFVLLVTVFRFLLYRIVLETKINTSASQFDYSLSHQYKRWSDEMLDNELKIPAVSHVQKKRKDIGNDNIVYLLHISWESVG